MKKENIYIYTFPFNLKRARARMLYATEAILIKFKIIILNCKFIQTNYKRKKKINMAKTNSNRITCELTHRDSVIFSIHIRVYLYISCVTNPPWTKKIIIGFLVRLPDGTYIHINTKWPISENNYFCRAYVFDAIATAQTLFVHYSPFEWNKYAYASSLC